MPARKAPSASDSPAWSVTQASPRVTSSTKSTKSSDDFWRATRSKSARVRRWPSQSTIASTIAALARATPIAIAISPFESASAGISTSSGITARSWKSSTPIAWRP